MIKKIFSIFLALVLCLLMAVPSFAITRPTSERASDWKIYAEEARENLSIREAAYAYEKAAELFYEEVDEFPELILEVASCYTRAAQSYIEARMFNEAISCFENAGDMCLKHEKINFAKKAYNDGLQIAADNDIQNCVQRFEEKLGDVYMILEQFQDAADYYRHRLDWLDGADYARVSLKYANAVEHVGEAEEIARAFESASGGACQQGNIDQSIELAKKAVDYYLQLDDNMHAQQVISHLIVNLLQSGEGEYAAQLSLYFYEKFGPIELAGALLLGVAVPYYESVGDNENLALAYNKAGDVYSAIGQEDLAQSCYKEAKQISSSASIITDGNLAIVTGIAAFIIGFIVAIIISKKKH